MSSKRRRRSRKERREDILGADTVRRLSPPVKVIEAAWTRISPSQSRERRAQVAFGVGSGPSFRYRFGAGGGVGGGVSRGSPFSGNTVPVQLAPPPMHQNVRCRHDPAPQVDDGVPEEGDPPLVVFKIEPAEAEVARRIREGVEGLLKTSGSFHDVLTIAPGISIGRVVNSVAGPACTALHESPFGDTHRRRATRGIVERLRRPRRPS